jgi:UDP-N-acetylglucosamine diphosphorylase/glucosamine-1-phosphate N-acetyltransferase
MTGPSVVLLFDDERSRKWHPFSLTRPIGEMLLGAFTPSARAERVFGIRCGGHIAPHLRGFEEPGAAPVVDAGAWSNVGRLFLSSRAVPAWGTRVAPIDSEAIILIGGQPAGWFAPPGSLPPPDFFVDPAAAAANMPRATRIEIGGYVMDDVWDLVVRAVRQIAEDIENGPSPAADPAFPLTGVEVLGEPPRLGASVTFEPCVVMDSQNGPIWIDDDVHIRAFTRIEGPAYIGPRTTILGGSLAGVSIGPHCKVRGEVEASIILGYSNKAHDGFIGHACLGRWVNLGALTTNSDLKNNYGKVRLWTPDGERDTGEIKIGCFLGDHVRTAIGTLLNTGTVVGPGANVFGAKSAGRDIPPFAWGDTGEVQDIERFVTTTRTAMGRRDVDLTDGMEQLLRATHERVREGRGS